ncbi:MAG: M17 family peptidase N-terminal domain-containing protein [Thermoanaerobaculia bacterium]
MARKRTRSRTKTPRSKGSPFEKRRKPRVDLRLAYGSITEVDARAVVLGLFQGVQDLSRAARAIDQRLNGAITELSQRRMFLGKVGEIFILPAARHDLRADLVICAGLGRFDRFEPAVLETVAENVARTLMRAKVADFAMVLFGATRGNLYGGLAHLVDGFFRGVHGSRERNPLRSITVCETDRKRCEKIETALAKLYRTRRSRQAEVTLGAQAVRNQAGRGSGSTPGRDRAEEGREGSE